MNDLTQKTHDESQYETFSYDDNLVKYFIYGTLFWGLVAMIAGVWAALQLADWRFNFGLEWVSFGRLRPIHTNAAIFAFVGNAMFAGVYHSTQRLCRARLYNDFLGRVHFWGWQLIIVLGALSLGMGKTMGKEYAELEWPLAIAIAVIWVVFAVNFFGTLWRRRERHMYVALWFYIATIVTVAVLHIINNISIPIDFMKSYPIYAGVQDALVQWWYGHNAVAFFLTTPFLGLMYYYVPKAAMRPVYSYRLSIIHFWSLVFIYIWAGPHHLLYSSLPDWVQTVGMVFSIALWAPSWGGMINGLLTIRGAWARLRTEPTLKFMATAITFYGMATFEGPLLSIKSVNALAHYTDWIIGHVHSGTIGWNYMLIAGILFYMIPKIWKTEIYSIRLANWQFWLATFGVLLYIVSLWVAGITQGLMWQAVDEAGRLVYPNFIETVVRIIPMYYVRAVGGVLVLISFVVMLYNFFKTIQGAPKNISVEKFKALPLVHQRVHVGEAAHRRIEGLPFVFSILATVAILVGSVVEIIPSLIAQNFVERDSRVGPYTPLELAGRDIYISEGCYLCHSQQIRPMVAEKLRYGDPSTAAESIYDRPFQWGSRRIGPDLSRVGSKYPDMWHYRHMWNPREVISQSIMPSYEWLFKKKIDFDVIPKKIRVMRALGVPYTDEQLADAVILAKVQAEAITEGLIASGVPSSMKDKEIIALIAYLQRLGKDTKEVAND